VSLRGHRTRVNPSKPTSYNDCSVLRMYDTHIRILLFFLFRDFHMALRLQPSIRFVQWNITNRCRSWTLNITTLETIAETASHVEFINIIIIILRCYVRFPFSFSASWVISRRRKPSGFEIWYDEHIIIIVILSNNVCDTASA